MKVLFDSDALFALYVVSDLLHLRAKKIFQDLLEKKAELLVSNLVVQETVTVISYKAGQKQAKDFLTRFIGIGARQVFIGGKLTIKAWNVFKQQNKKGTSFIDCANAVLYKEMKIDKIFSFDKFYKKLGLKMLG